MPEKQFLDRAMYKHIKSMNKTELSEFLQKVYDMGRDSVHIDVTTLENDLLQIKGIGSARVKEIITVITTNIT